MNGLVVINKPAGWSSARVVSRVKRLLRARKVGHTGTLDPFARGVLVCCIDQATRLARFLLEGPKTYEGVLTLGIETDTQDATGRVTAQRPWAGVTEEDLHRVLARYEGAYRQVPPTYSALKHEGVPLYTLARRGQPVQKPARDVFIHHLRRTAAELPRVRLEVRCSAGTYIRTLCADIGRDLGCGGHLSELTRLESGGFTLEEALTLEDLEERVRRGAWSEVVIPMARALPALPEITAAAPLLEKVRHGQALARADLGLEAAPNGGAAGGGQLLKLIDSRGELLALLEHAPGTGAIEYRCVFAGPEGG
jgi:tRNA pseudouridine55 synthase